MVFLKSAIVFFFIFYPALHKYGFGLYYIINKQTIYNHT